MPLVMNLSQVSKPINYRIILFAVVEWLSCRIALSRKRRYQNMEHIEIRLFQFRVWGTVGLEFNKCLLHLRKVMINPFDLNNIILHHKSVQIFFPPIFYCSLMVKYCFRRKCQTLVKIYSMYDAKNRKTGTKMVCLKNDRPMKCEELSRHWFWLLRGALWGLGLFLCRHWWVISRGKSW